MIEKVGTRASGISSRLPRITILAIACAMALASCNDAENKSKTTGGKSTSRENDKRYVVSKNQICDMPSGYVLNGKTSPAFYGLWHLRLNRHAELDWNGQKITADILRAYLREFERVHGDEFLSVEIEAYTLCDAVETLRSTIAESGLCAEGRCVENAWNIKAPIVH